MGPYRQRASCRIVISGGLSLQRLQRFCAAVLGRLAISAMVISNSMVDISDGFLFSAVDGRDGGWEDKMDG